MLIGEKSEVYYSTGSHQEDERIKYEKERDMENLIEMEANMEMELDMDYIYEMTHFTRVDEDGYPEELHNSFR